MVPSGSTTIKNGFDGLSVAGCSLRSLATGNFPLTISELVKLPNESRFRIFETATMLAATIRNNRIKAISLQADAAYRADWMQDRSASDALADTRLWNATNGIG
jgi:hypothetical protein